MDSPLLLNGPLRVLKGGRPHKVIQKIAYRIQYYLVNRDIPPEFQIELFLKCKPINTLKSFNNLCSIRD